MTTTTQLLSWGGYTTSASIEDDITDYVGEFGDDYDLPGLADAYRDAINTALTGTTIVLRGNEFYADYPAPENAADLIRAAIETVGVGFDVLAQQYDRSD